MMCVWSIANKVNRQYLRFAKKKTAALQAFAGTLATMQGVVRTLQMFMLVVALCLMAEGSDQDHVATLDGEGAAPTPVKFNTGSTKVAARPSPCARLRFSLRRKKGLWAVSLSLARCPLWGSVDSSLC